MRLSSFQIGSAMGDILVTSIWNRIMISNFGIAAAPVSLLIALRYFLAPISLWAGYLSDTKPLWGFRRTPYIWLGRALMIISLPLLGLSLVRLGVDQQDILGWFFATISSLLYGVGTLISGSPFVTLVRDSAPPEKQGLAISTVQTVLIIFFAVFGIVFGLWMEVYDQRIFWQMILATMAVGGFFWFFAIVGVEKHVGIERHCQVRPLSRWQVLGRPCAKYGAIHARAVFLFFCPWPQCRPGCRMPSWNHLGLMFSRCRLVERRVLTVIGRSPQ